MGKRIMIDTAGALERLKGRGFEVTYPTLARWLQKGLIEGAEQEDTPRGPVWKMPLASVERFEPPKKGRPVKPKGVRSSKRARKRDA